MLNQINQKIEWYREVLSIEPSSRVFFALAKLLAQNDQKNEAIEIIKQGLIYHPEYIEAKLFLFELLQEENQSEEKNLNELTQVLTSYPKFWTAWSEQETTNLDLSCTVGMLGLILKQDQLTIQKIILAGINSLNNKKTKTIITSPLLPVIPEKITEEQIELEKTENINVEKVIQAETLVEDLQTEDFLPERLIEDTISKSSETEDIQDLKCSTYTRSMAELLAEQGDIGGALNILEKLLVIHKTQKDTLGISDIKKRIETLSSYGDDTPQMNKNEKNITSLNNDLKVKERNKDTNKQNKTLTFLSNLASRLEARSISANI